MSSNSTPHYNRTAWNSKENCEICKEGFQMCLQCLSQCVYKASVYFFNQISLLNADEQNDTHCFTAGVHSETREAISSFFLLPLAHLHCLAARTSLAWPGAVGWTGLKLPPERNCCFSGWSGMNIKELFMSSSVLAGRNLFSTNVCCQDIFPYIYLLPIFRSDRGGRDWKSLGWL